MKNKNNLYERIKNLGKDQLRAIYDENLKLGRNDLLSIVKKRKDSRNSKDYSQEGMALFYLGANELKRDQLPEKTIEGYLNLKDPYDALFSESQDKNLKENLLKEINSFVTPENKEELIKSFGNFASYMSYMRQSQAVNLSPKKEQMYKERYFMECPVHSSIMHNIGEAESLYFAPIKEVLGELPKNEEYNGLATRIYKSQEDLEETIKIMGELRK